MIKSLISILKLKQRIRPRTYYDDLAELGVLEEYLHTLLSDKYNNDPAFREEMFETLLKHSRHPVPELEVHYLERICESLSYFGEYTRPWRKQEP